MKTIGFVLLLLLVSTGCSKKAATTPPAAAPPAPISPKPVATLSEDDARLLDSLFTLGLFDPVETGAVRVHGMASLSNCFAKPDVRKVSGWLVSGKEGRPTQFVLDNLQETLPPDTHEPRDLETEAKQFLKTREWPDPCLRQPGLYVYRDSQLAVWAAWLHRLGHDETAACLLPEALKESPSGKLASDFTVTLGWQLLDQAFNAFRDRQDSIALRSVEKLLKLESPYSDQAQSILADLRRRQAEGTFGKPRPPLPDDFPSWPAERRIAKLIERLDDVNAPQRGSPGYIELDQDPRFIDVCFEGERAVPALLECLEKDLRLTRSFSYWRHYQPSREQNTVRTIAYSALQVILKTEFMSPFTGKPQFDPENQNTDGAAQARAYWKTYGALPFARRMLAILADEKLPALCWQEAAGNFAHWGQLRAFTRDTWLSRTSRKPSGLDPELASIQNPTVAEAVLAAFDRNVGLFATRGRDVAFYGLEHLEAHYLKAVAEIADPRIIPELKRRIPGAKTTGLRRKLAFAIHRLGDSGPIDDLARDFSKGRIALPANDREEVAGNMQGAWQPGNMELRNIVGDISRAGTKAAEEALSALTRDEHPQYFIAAERLRYCRPGSTEDEDWFGHPFCLRILRQELEKRKGVGVHLLIKGDSMVWSTKDAQGEKDLPDVLKRPEQRNEEGEERWCDSVAEQLNLLVLGLPEYHPLMRDPDKTLNQMARVMDRFQGRFRKLTSREANALGLREDQPWYIPDIAPVRAKATEEDVTKGRALFFLLEQTTPVAVTLPSIATAKGVHGKLLILQAEKRSDGTIEFGGIAPFAIGCFPQSQIEEIRPLGE